MSEHWIISDYERDKEYVVHSIEKAFCLVKRFLKEDFKQGLSKEDYIRCLNLLEEYYSNPTNGCIVGIGYQIYYCIRKADKEQEYV